MANTINLNAEIGANYIGDDAQPALQFSNTSTGPGLVVDKFVSTSSATLAGNVSITPVALLTRNTVVAAATVAVLTLDLGSTPSGALFELQNQGFVSATTILFTTGATSGTGAIRVKYGDNYGWIPILPSGSVTGAAR